jgi:cation diffusion facilitator family transporter
MGTSIVIDVSRSRMLIKAARKFNSQALEADALHFSTDVWSSSVVILGLFGMLAAKIWPSLSFLEKADSVAAMVVALIVVYVSIEMGIRTVKGLLDTAPEGMTARIKEVTLAVPGVTGCHRVRVRSAGAHYFVDVHIQVKATSTLKTIHPLTHAVINAVRKEFPGADVTVHPEPLEEIDK